MPIAPEVEIRRSRRRRKSVQAYRDESNRIVVLVPAGLEAGHEARLVASMVARIERREARRPASDTALLARATELSKRHLDGAAVPASVRWVSNQRTRWGSCTIEDRTIRLSDRLQPMPSWVVDYVLVHELAHLLVADHSEEFWALVGRYPRSERARGYLDGIVAGARLAGRLDDCDVAS